MSADANESEATVFARRMLPESQQPDLIIRHCPHALKKQHREPARDSKERVRRGVAQDAAAIAVETA